MTIVRRVLGWSLGLWRLAAGRIRADWRFLVGVWLLLACATTLLAAGVVYGDAVAVGSLRSTIRTAPAADQGVSIEASLSSAEIQTADGRVRASIATALGPTGTSTTVVIRTGSLVRAAVPGSSGSAGSSTPTLTVLEGIDDPGGHATLVDGRWPQPNGDPVEAAVSRGAATSLGLHLGDRVPLGDASLPGADPNHPVVTVVIVGIDEPIATDPVWAGSALDLTGVGTISGSTFHGPFLVAPADLVVAGRFARLDATWRANLDFDRAVADDIEPLRANLTGLPQAVHGAFPPGRTVAVNVGLQSLLDGVDRSLQVARGAVFLLTLQFAVVAVYAVLLVAGMLADRRRPEIGLLRSRGASTAHIVTLAFGEAVLLAVPAAVVAPFLATGLVRLLGQVGPLASTGAVGNAAITPTVVTAVAVTGLLAALVLTVPAMAAGAEVAGIRAVLGRPVARTFAQRLGIDVALIVVAALAIWQLRTYGAPLTRTANGSLGFDPLLIAAPAFGLLAGGVLATRLVPRLGEAGERLLDHGRGLVSPLGARQIARRPLRYTRAALLLMLSTALGTFGAVYASTWTASQTDQAAYQTGADVRVAPAAGTTTPSWALGAAIRAVPGVSSATPVARRDLSIGSVVRSGVLLAADAGAFGRIATLPSGPEASQVAPALDVLLKARPNVAVLAVPPGARWLRLRLDADLGEVGPTFTGDNGQQVTIDVPPDYRGISIAAVVRDADGRLSRFAMDATGQLGLWKSHDEAVVVPLSTDRVPIPGSGSTDPRDIVGLEVTLGDPYGNGYVSPITGSLQLLGADVSTHTTPGSSEWTPIDLGPAADWPWLERDVTDSFQTLGTGTKRFVLQNDPQLATGNDMAIRFMTPMPADATVAAIASNGLLAAAGSLVGDTLGGRSGGDDVQLKVIASTPEFPTISPTTPFAIVDGPTLDLTTYLATGNVPLGGEWWLTVQPGATPDVVSTLGAAPFPAAKIVDRASTLSALENDPIGLATLGALILGSLAAAAFAVVGFLVGASVSTRERLGEFALLRALGLSGRQLTGWLAAEQAFLLGLGLVAGIGIGLLLGVLIVPETLLGPSGATVVPVPRIVVPWLLLGGVAVGALALLLLTVALVGRPLPGRRIAAILRTSAE